MKGLAVIPARGGSKGIPRKNLVVLGGKPLIAWTIEAAKAARCVERIVVSTDDEEIAQVARHWGAEVPFMRPPALAADDTPGAAPIEHAVAWLAEHENYRPGWVACLQPTSPFRSSADIEEAGLRLEQTGADAVVSLVAPDKHPFWMKRLAADGRLMDLFPRDEVPSRRQDLPPVYALNGALYLIRCAVLLEQHTLFPANTVGYIMPRERSLDIDSIWDLKLANWLMAGGAETKT